MTANRHMLALALALALLVPEVDSNDIRIDRTAHEAQIAEIENGHVCVRR